MASISRNDSGMLTALFNDRASAEQAYQVLSERGYMKDDINVVMSDDTRKKHFAQQGTAQTELGSKAAEGAGVGGAIGGTLGAVIAAAMATGASIALPGIGLVVAGPLAAAAAGAGAGAATGGLLGALVGWGIPEENVKRYESGLKGGGIMIGVRPRSEEDADYIEQRWRSLNAQDVYRPGRMAQTADSGRTSVIGVYDDYADAEGAVQALTADGIQRSRIHLQPESEIPASGKTAKAAKAAKAEAEHGAAGISGFFRSLFGTEEHKEHHDVYAESVRRGSYVLTFEAQDHREAERASDIMNRFNPVNIDERAGAWKQQGWSGYEAAAPKLSQKEIEKERSSYRPATTQAGTTEQSTFPVIEEEFKVGKRLVQRGGIRIFRHVTERPVHESVQLREEHVKVERHAVDQPASEADLAAFKEGSVELREMAEEPVVSKTAHVIEEVTIGKEVSQKTEEINDTVRKTDVEVEQLGASDTGRGTTAAVKGDDDAFRRHWQTAYGSSGGRYEDYDAAYRYGSTMAGSERFKNYRWEDAEPDMRSDWERQHPESTWDKVKDAVRYGAERVGGSRRH
ncbi:YsnF/AvaK domain-containing protein [Noviherbaspirillum sp.]|uniref:YsnF/AvaK domain-containing protein n=1 Tax=Noviherbaspirillum sp. TaxID=1926288 RepID=UPI0025D752D6|nr:YsnF/AvaK domain-containing protein [Noviherbaspirillum sp.]